MSRSRDPLIIGRIVGDVIDYFDASARLRVSYGNREMTVGSELRPSQVANQPTMHITGRAGSLYTLVSALVDHIHTLLLLQALLVHMYTYKYVAIECMHPWRAPPICFRVLPSSGCRGTIANQGAPAGFLLGVDIASSLSLHQLI